MIRTHEVDAVVTKGPGGFFAVQPLLRGHVESLTDGNLALNPSWLLIPGEFSNLRRVNRFLPSRLAGGITASSVVTQDSGGFGLGCGRGLVHGAGCRGQHSLDRRDQAPGVGTVWALRPLASRCRETRSLSPRTRQAASRGTPTR